MRFAAPRSESPSPVRRRATRRKSAFGVPPDSSDEESDVSDTASSASSSDSFAYASESEVPPPQPKPTRPGRTVADAHYMEDTIASIRLRVTHHDVYEEWEQQTRKDAFITARHQQAASRAERRQNLLKGRKTDLNRQEAMHNRQMEEVQAQLAAFNMRTQTEEQKLLERWKERDRQLWERIESGIKLEEERLKAKLEAEQRQREEQEKRLRAELERRVREEERKRQEEERLRREEEEKRQKKEKDEESARQKAEQERAEEHERAALGMTTAMQDLTYARGTLLRLKSGPMKTVKADKALKSMWSAARRQITPKIGQLTNDLQSVNRITQQIIQILRPSAPLPFEVYLALLSSLAKSILLQAETEVTAEKRSAIPLAQVTVNLLEALDEFAGIFWAKLCQRAGGWPVPAVIPSTDLDGTPFTDETRAKVLGYRGTEEPLSDYITRVSGIMRVYFHVLCAPTTKPLDPMFRLPRFWTYFARLLSEPQLLESSVAPSILHAALDVGGTQVQSIWGHQWIKLLATLYEGVTSGFDGRLVGGKSPEGTAARMRVQLEVERIMTGS